MNNTKSTTGIKITKVANLILLILGIIGAVTIALIIITTQDDFKELLSNAKVPIPPIFNFLLSIPRIVYLLISIFLIIFLLLKENFIANKSVTLWINIFIVIAVWAFFSYYLCILLKTAFLITQSI